MFWLTPSDWCRMPLVQMLIASILLMGQAQAQPAAGLGSELVVDVVSLKSGKSLRGAIASQQPNGGLLMAVSTAWLKNSQPALAETALAETVVGRTTAWNQIRDRLTKPQHPPIDSPQLDFFLKQELERIDACIAEKNPLPVEFVWLDVRVDSITKVQRAAPARQRIASFAWKEKLANIETRGAESLQLELTERGVKLEAPSPDLGKLLAARPQDDEEWNSRLALIEYVLVKPLDFQGMGDTLARTSEGQSVNLGEILPKLFKQQFSVLLKDATGDVRPVKKGKESQKWLTVAVRQAEQAKVRGFRVTRLEMDLASSQVTVETRFIARVADKKWKTIWLTKEQGDGTQAHPEMEARIEQDPQFKSALDKVKSLGIADNGLLKLAVRIGAATMAAQQSVDGAFAGFKDRYVRHLDAPPLAPLVNP